MKMEQSSETSAYKIFIKTAYENGTVFRNVGI